MEDKVSAAISQCQSTSKASSLPEEKLVYEGNICLLFLPWSRVEIKKFANENPKVARGHYIAPR